MRLRFQRNSGAWVATERRAGSGAAQKGDLTCLESQSLFFLGGHRVALHEPGELVTEAHRTARGACTPVELDSNELRMTQLAF